MAPRKKGKERAKEPIRVRKVKEVTFDEDARKEFLTGFSKRKKQREAAVRNKAIERDRLERLEMRRTIREERKQRAAENVRQAQILFGGGDEGAEDDDDEEDDEDEEEQGEAQEYETTDLVTTVSVEPFSLSRSPTPDIVPSTSTDEPKKQQQPTKLHKKRVKNAPQARPKMTKTDKKLRATGSKGQKTKLMSRNKGTKGRAVK